MSCTPFPKSWDFPRSIKVCHRRALKQFPPFHLKQDIDYARLSYSPFFGILADYRGAMWPVSPVLVEQKNWQG